MVESAAVNGNATWRIRYGWSILTRRACVVAFAIFLFGMLCGKVPLGLANRRQEEHVTTLRGRVLNAVTNEPVGRALVVMRTENVATFTDDRGQFELKIPEKKDAGDGATGTTHIMLATRGGFLEARKPGFIEAQRMATPPLATGSATKDQPEVTIRLVPEALIVGHVEVPGSEGEVRIRCELYRREMREGRETWSAQRSFTTWADGEVRFSSLQAGAYKLITHEQMDRDSMPAAPGAQAYGFPPVYYQNTTDFSLATPIVVKAGETARVNLTVVRHEYYPVTIAVANVPPGARLDLKVYPMGHPSPGWSLGYNPAEGAIEGILPDGNYTVEASAPGEEGEVTGILNFSVKGRPLEGPTLNLVPDATVTVRLREELQSGLSNFAAPETEPANPSGSQRGFSNVQVNLWPIDELPPFGRGAGSRQAETSQGPNLIIQNVRPGRYQMVVNSGIGYAASIQSGGKDLLHQPLVVGLGGGVAPIEIVLRDDGAEVDGTLEEEGTNPATAEAHGIPPNRTVYLLPVKEGARPQTATAWQGKFTIAQVPPGDYLVVAFEQPSNDLTYGSAEAVQSLSRKGQMLHLEAGQKVSVTLKLAASEGE